MPVGLLIADDQVAGVLFDYFRPLGYDPISVGLPDQALEQISKNKGMLDVMILDIWMNWVGHGVLDTSAGLKVLKKTKTRLDPDLGVVIITGHGDGPRNDCMTNGADAFVSKGN